MKPTLDDPGIKKPDSEKSAAQEPASDEGDSRRRKTFVDRNTTDKGLAVYTREWLEERSKQELVELVLELRLRLELRTSKLDSEDSWIPFDSPAFKAGVDTTKHLYLPVPQTVKRAGHQGEEAQHAWRMLLINADTAFEPIGLKVRGDAFVGRTHGGLTADVDLTGCDGLTLGVSRHHALLRPTDEGLTLTDLDSTNGTYVNGTKLRPGKGTTLKAGDLISVGQVHFMVKLLEKETG